MRPLASGAIVWLTLSTAATAAIVSDITILHSFTGQSDGGKPAYDGLVVSGSTLYGVSPTGGSAYIGSLFTMQLDGSQYTRIYSFPSSQLQGVSPYALALDGSTIYGTAVAGGTAHCGTLYSIQSNGTGFQLLHSFTGTMGDGANPYDGVAISDSCLYGETPSGGYNDNGIIFSVAKDGTDYRILHTFSGGSDGLQPCGAPTISGATLYGMSPSSIYKVNTDGSGYQVLRSGVGGTGRLTLSGSTLYGVAGAAVFRINTDGSDFQVLHTLAGTSQSSLTLVGSTLYGVTRWGGSANEGTLFCVNTDGSNYQLLHTFAGGSNDGGEPLCTLVAAGSSLYGSTWEGGATNHGIVFSFPVPEPSTLILLGIGAIGVLGGVAGSAHAPLPHLRDERRELPLS